MLTMLQMAFSTAASLALAHRAGRHSLITLLAVSSVVVTGIFLLPGGHGAETVRAVEARFSALAALHARADSDDDDGRDRWLSRHADPSEPCGIH